MRYYKTLLKLKQEGSMSRSSVPDKLFFELHDEGLIRIEQLSARKQKVHITPDFLVHYQDLEAISTATTRAELSQKGFNTKEKKISPQEGLYLNGVCQLFPTLFLPIVEESAFFVKRVPEIAGDITIVVVENFENLIYHQHIASLMQLSQYLVIFGRNNLLYQFLKESNANKIIYFGDFDLAGISIYLHEIYPCNNHISFFIPHNIESLIKEYGVSSLYTKQFTKYKELSNSIVQIQTLINTIHSTQKSLEQEFFINKWDILD
jgi:hypothetical protein